MKRGRPDKASDGTTLKKLGITRDQSSLWQRMAQVPQETVEAYFAATTQIPTAAGLLRFAGQHVREKVRRCPHCGGRL